MVEMLLTGRCFHNVKAPFGEQPRQDRPVLPADPLTLGATLTEGGCNFAIWTQAATAVELCLFNEVNGKLVETRFALSHRN